VYKLNLEKALRIQSRKEKEAFYKRMGGLNKRKVRPGKRGSLLPSKDGNCISDLKAA